MMVGENDSSPGHRKGDDDADSFCISASPGHAFKQTSSIDSLIDTKSRSSHHVGKNGFRTASMDRLLFVFGSSLGFSKQQHH
jgi:hypothetical protein